jgi:hypothetical protein
MCQHLSTLQDDSVRRARVDAKEWAHTKAQSLLSQILHHVAPRPWDIVVVGACVGWVGGVGVGWVGGGGWGGGGGARWVLDTQWALGGGRAHAAGDSNRLIVRRGFIPRRVSVQVTP